MLVSMFNFTHPINLIGTGCFLAYFPQLGIHRLPGVLLAVTSGCCVSPGDGSCRGGCDLCPAPPSAPAHAARSYTASSLPSRLGSPLRWKVSCKCELLLSPAIVEIIALAFCSTKVRYSQAKHFKHLCYFLLCSCLTSSNLLSQWKERSAVILFS